MSRRDKGHAMLELAASAGVMLACLGGTFQFGYTFYAYNQLVSNAAATPVQQQLTAANSKLAEFEQAANAAAEAELTALATELATNSKVLTAADFKSMGLARCKELKAANKGAAPIVPGSPAPAGGADEFASYDINSHFEEAK